MKVFISTIILACLTVATFETAWSVEPPGGPEQRGGAGPRAQRGPSRGMTFKRLLQRADVNRDGKVTRDEFRGPAQFFDRLDQNSDGVVTRVEFDAINGHQARDGRRGGRRSGRSPRGGAETDATAVFQLLDADRSGQVDRRDLEGILSRLDADGDGAISQQELQSALRSSPATSRKRADHFREFPGARPAPGSEAPPFQLQTLAGKKVSLQDLLETKPVVLEFGSFT